MTFSFGGWSILGIAAAVAIVAGIVLLIAYAVERGLVHRELDGVEPEAGATGTAPVGREHGSGRRLGIVGSVVLAVGLGMGVLAALTGWGGAGIAGQGGPGVGPVDCAQSWTGCPKATPGP